MTSSDATENVGRTRPDSAIAGSGYDTKAPTVCSARVRIGDVRVCSACGRDFPLSKSQVESLQTLGRVFCGQVCWNTDRKTKLFNSAGQKRCTVCGVWKAPDLFRPRSKDGRPRAECRDCGYATKLQCAKSQRGKAGQQRRKLAYEARHPDRKPHLRLTKCYVAGQLGLPVDLIPDSLYRARRAYISLRRKLKEETQ